MRPHTIIHAFVIAGLLLSCQGRKDYSEKRETENLGDHLSKGEEIAGRSFAALAGQLSSAMQQGGVQNAVAYCNLKANPIMDSLSREFNATISRVTLKARNPQNHAIGIDSTILADYGKALSGGEAIKAFVMAGEDGAYYFYAPIRIISPLCLKCHGKPEETITQADYEFILSKYPSDKAIDYSEGELRGMWKIVFLP